MGVSIQRGATVYVGDPITMKRGTVNDITAVKVFHTTDPTVHPSTTSFTVSQHLVKDSSDTLWAGQVEAVSRIGPRGEISSLTPGDYQRWVLITTADEDIIESTGTVTIL